MEPDTMISSLQLAMPVDHDIVMTRQKIYMRQYDIR